jgi:hypothetical protein
MSDKEIQFRKKREVGEIISDTIEFLKQEYKPIFRLIGIYVLPFLILYGIVQINIQMKIMGNVDFTDPESMMANIGPIYLNVFFSSFFALFVQSLLAGTFYSYLEVYIKKGKGNFELAEITPHLFSNSLIALGANMVLFIAVVIGVILCILPGLYFANTFSLLVMIAIFEKKGISSALTRSWNLVNSQWWNTLLLNILAIVILWGIGFFVSIPTMFTGVSNSILSIQETGVAQQPTWFWVLNGIATIITATFWIIPYTFLAFQYFNLDERSKPFHPQNLE